MLVALNIEIEVRSYSNLLSRNASACGADLPATTTNRLVEDEEGSDSQNLVQKKNIFKIFFLNFS